MKTKCTEVKLWKALSNYDYVIGIDAGTKTGFAMWDRKGDRFTHISTLKIHEAMNMVQSAKAHYSANVLVRVEDARKRNWFGNTGREKLQGAGSVKRDCSIWEDFLKDIGVDYELVAPKNNRTKLTADAFKATTKYEGKTSEHGRDAAMLVFKL